MTATNSFPLQQNTWFSDVGNPLFWRIEKQHHIIYNEIPFFRGVTTITEREGAASSSPYPSTSESSIYSLDFVSVSWANYPNSLEQSAQCLHSNLCEVCFAGLLNQGLNRERRSFENHSPGSNHRTSEDD